MLFLVEIDRPQSGSAPSFEEGISFIEEIILPTLEQLDRLTGEKKIMAGGVAVGRVSLRFMIEADSPEEVDKIVSSIPLWAVSETKITSLISIADRRSHVQVLLKRLADRITLHHG